MRAKPSMTVNNITLLVDIRRDLVALLQRVDQALGEPGEGSPRSPRRVQVPVSQTYPPGFDHRGDPEGLRMALVALYDRVVLVDRLVDNFDTDDLLRHEVCLRAAQARLLQTQTEEGSREWETAVGIIRTLTRVVADTKPGFVYGLASTHNTNWGMKIQEILGVYTPIPL